MRSVFYSKLAPIEMLKYLLSILSEEQQSIAMFEETDRTDLHI